MSDHRPDPRRHKVSEQCCEECGELWPCPHAPEQIQFVKDRRRPAGTNIYEVIDWIGEPDWSERWLPRPPGGIALKTPDGLEWAVPGDYIVRGDDGRCFPVEGDR